MQPKIAEQLEIDAKYAVYLDARPRMSPPSAATKALNCLPEDHRLCGAQGLSHEVRQKLAGVRPRTIGQAGRIDGITPAALTLLVAHVRRCLAAGPDPAA